jgi:hypothetical protein
LQVVKIDLSAFHQALCQTEHLRSIVSPGTTRQVEWPPGEQIANRTESATSAMLHRHPQRIANGKTQQQTAITLA